MVRVLQPGDLNAGSFTNAGTANAGGVTVRTDAPSQVGLAIAAAIAALPNAGDALRGLAQLSVGVNFPQPTNDTEATTPRYVDLAIDAAIAALPGDKFLQGLQSYNPATNIMTLLLSDGTTVPVDLSDLLADAIASITTGKVVVQANDGSTLGYLLPV